MAERVPRPFLVALAALTEWLKAVAVPGMVVGGVAVSVLGRPRATRDIDALAMAPDAKWTALVAAAKDHGMAARISEPLEFARRTHVLLLRHLESEVDIDVILGRLPYEAEAIARARAHDLGGVSVNLPQVEDLLILKAIACRPQDLRDIEGLLDLHPDADVARVRRWVSEFSTAMTMPELLQECDKLLAQRRR